MNICNRHEELTDEIKKNSGDIVDIKLRLVKGDGVLENIQDTVNEIKAEIKQPLISTEGIEMILKFLKYFFAVIIPTILGILGFAKYGG